MMITKVKRSTSAYSIYLGFLCGVVFFFVYLTYNGIKMINTDDVEHVDKQTRTQGRTRFYHK